MEHQKKRSRTHSAAKSSSSEPLSGSIFFLDESILASALIQDLRALGAVVEVLPAHFPRGTPDEEWLQAVGAKGWIVLTKDTRIRYRKLEQEALMRHKVKAFVFTGGAVTGIEMAAILTKAAPKIVRMARTEKPPYIYVVGKSAKPTRVR